MSEHSIGNVYKGYFQYQDSADRDFRRLLLTDISGDIGIMTQITGQPPNNPPKYYDRYREPIEKWEQAGLTRKSYARVNKNFPIPINVLNKPIGIMDEEEFIRIASAALSYISKNGFKH